MLMGGSDNGIELLRNSDIVNFPLETFHFASYVLAGVSR